ncbi:hypothetical protein [Afifella aestuarii]|uniref:hypothetical protein n=1 Tax=Afifella aestuarii TaxID=1909496 RepID=UPI000FE2F7AD|nr:hypothetical protein [Afifella aestuarii]
MRKVLTCVSATAAFLLLASAASADCSFHRQQVMASKAPVAEEKVAMATTPTPLSQVATRSERNAAPKKECAAGDTACTGGTK